MRRNIKGSITIFSAMTIMLVAQFVFLLLEGARYVETQKAATIESQEAVESVMAQYCKPLWEEYHLLGYDCGNGFGEINLGQIQEEYDYRKQEREGRNLLKSQEASVIPENYTLLSDNEGCVYEAAIAAYMKENFVYEEAKVIYSYYKSLKEIRDGNNYDDSYIDDALDALAQKEDGKNGIGGKLQRSSTKAGSKEDNPLSDVGEVQAKGILAVVLGKNKEISGNSLHEERLSKRSINQGKNPTTFESKWYENVLLCQYMSSYMSCYTDTKNHGLKYEMEYLLAGKDSDEENLKSVVNELLAIREAANMLHIIMDAEKQSEVLALATAIAGASVNPLVIEAVKLGLIAAWAYCESILDLRALLQGGRVPLIKSAASWTAGLNGISELLSGNTKAKSSKAGLSYKEYGAILLMFSKTKTLAYRGMDVQEATIRKIKGYESVKMDNMICDLKISAEYKYNPVFGGMVHLITGADKGFIKKLNSDYSYIESKNK